MVDKLRQIIAAGNSVAVQSIGHPTPSSPTWPQVAFWLSEFGANPDTFTTIDGPYAFLGNPQLGLTEVAESSHTIEPDPTSATRESGTLRGRARIRNDGYFMPVATDTADALAFPLYEIVFQDPTPWPYTCSTCDPTTPGAPVDVAAYARALADITAYLPDLRDWAPDLRKAYVGNDTLTYSDSKTDLLAMPYPGDGYTCTDDAGRIEEGSRLHAQAVLQAERRAADRVRLARRHPDAVQQLRQGPEPHRQPAAGRSGDDRHVHPQCRRAPARRGHLVAHPPAHPEHLPPRRAGWRDHLRGHRGSRLRL